MENIQATPQLQIAHLDFLGIGVIEGGKDVPVLFITDHFYVACTSPGNIFADF